jgi:hypothetical protein
LPAPTKASIHAITRILTADWFWALCLLIGAVLIPSPLPNAETVLGMPKLCIFRNLTGIACPGCGMTRSLISTGHGHLDQALDFHPLGPAIFTLLALSVATGVNDYVPNPNKALQKLKGLLRVPLIISAAGFLIVWVLRLCHVIMTPP